MNAFDFGSASLHCGNTRPGPLEIFGKNGDTMDSPRAVESGRSPQAGFGGQGVVTREYVMFEWNIVITVFEHQFRRACDLLAPLGPLRKTGYFNVLAMKIEDTEGFLKTLKAWSLEDPGIFTECISRAIPLNTLFGFQTPEEFETRAREAALRWLPEIAGQRFHVRMHRRGFAGRLSSQDEERFLDGFLLGKLEEAGTPASIGFDDPDAILAIETIGQRAGLSLWNRERLQNYPFLGLD